VILFSLFIYGFSYNKNVSCTDELIRIGKDTLGYRDIFDTGKISNNEEPSIVLTNAIRYLKGKNSNKLRSELSVLSPEYSSCAWLQVNYVERAGLGHSLSSFVNYLADAVRNSLTFHSSFFTSAHNLCDLNETANFFGLHSVFFRSRYPTLNNSVIIDIENSTMRCNSSSIYDAVVSYKKDHGNFDCRNKHVIFRCYNKNAPFYERVAKSITGVSNILHASFLSAYKIYRRNHIHPLLKSAESIDHLLIAVHIRRGDILRSKKIVRVHRLVSYYTYAQTIKILLAMRASNSITNALPVKVFILCEDSIDNDTILEYNENNPNRDFKKINVSHDLSSVCSSTSTTSGSCEVNVVWDADIYEAVTIMCEADILVTSTSGFAWAAAAFCSPPLTISFPWGNTYDEIDNVLPVALGNVPLWSANTRVWLPQLNNTSWMKMIQLRKERRKDRQLL